MDKQKLLEWIDNLILLDGWLAENQDTYDLTIVKKLREEISTGKFNSRPVEVDVSVPKRKFYLEAKIGADTIEDLEYALDDIIRSYKQEQTTKTIFGAPSFGGRYELDIDENMTHEEYMRLIINKTEAH